MKRIGVTILVFSTLLIQSCSITGLTTGIIINSRSFEEIPVHEDTLQALPSDNEIKVTLQGGKNHYGKFLKVEKISVYQKNYAPIIGFTIGLMIDFMIFHNIHLDFGPH